MKDFFLKGPIFLATNTVETQDSFEKKIAYYHLDLFLILLPFDRFYSQLTLISLLLHTLIYLTKQKIRLALSWQNLVLVSVFLLTVVGLAWTDYKAEALKDTERQLAIFLFPLLLSATGLDLGLYKKKLLLVFGITCVMTILFLYADAARTILYYHLSLKSLLSPAFINHNFSEPISMHATYLSMYAALSLASFLYYFIHEKNRTIRFLYAAGILILLAGLVQLASKSVLISTVIFIAFGILYFRTKGAGKYKALVVVLAVSLLTLFLITRVDAFNKRYIAGLKDDLSQAYLDKEIADPRILRWQCALELVRQSPITGHGSGSEKKLLKEKYFENKLYNSYLHELDAHNQYLSFLLKTGAIGLLVFLGTLYTGFAAAWVRRDFVFTSFMILISIVSFSENILDVNKGIFFYSFFFSFFVLAVKPNQLKRSHSNQKASLSKTYSDI